MNKKCIDMMLRKNFQQQRRRRQKEFNSTLNAVDLFIFGIIVFGAVAFLTSLTPIKKRYTGSSSNHQNGIIAS